MIKISKTDTIIDIIGKINSCEGNDVILDFPFGHPVLHNYLSLKILKNKAGTKALVIITNDLTSKKIGKKLGIKYSIINDSKFIQEENILKHNFTFFEYFKFLILKYIRESKDFALGNKKLNSLKKYSKKYHKQKSRIGYFLIALVGSVVVLLFIFYFAVNKTYIYITPEIEIKTISRNLIFAEIDEGEEITNPKVIKLKKTNHLTQLKEKFSSSGYEEKNVKMSSGSAILFNKTAEEIKLKPQTRLQTSDGLIFETEQWAIIPKASLSASGTLVPGEVEVIAHSRLKDRNGKIIGERGNIGENMGFIMPGLPEVYWELIYGKSSSNFSGGFNLKEKIVTREDIDNAKLFLEGKLKTKALEMAKQKILEDNDTNSVTYDILQTEQSIQYTKADIKLVGDVKPNDKVMFFELKGSIEINVYTFNKESVINYLRNEVNSTTLDEIEEVLLMDSKSLRLSNTIYEVKPYEVKATMEAEVYFIHNFLNENDAYVNRLKGSILGLDREEAIKILLNNNKVSNVKIETRPFFIKKVSNIYDNIELRVEKR